jgi:beta-glucanase (GH16 family)
MTPTQSLTFQRLDPGFWTANYLGSAGQITHPPNKYELAAFDPARVRCSGGALDLSIVQDPYETDGQTFAYRSGCITGYQKQAYVYGSFAARLYIPATPDGQIFNWPAFWLVGDPWHWPGSGEIDVMEGLAGDAWLHWRDSTDDGLVFRRRVPGNFGGWHWFAVDWRADRVRWSYDGTVVAERVGPTTSEPMFPVISYSLSDWTSEFCRSGPDYCGGPTNVTAVMKISAFLTGP